MRLIHVAARKIEALLPKICQVCACNAIFYAMKTGAVVMGIPAPPSALPTLPGQLVSIFLRHAIFLRCITFPVPFVNTLVGSHCRECSAAELATRPPPCARAADLQLRGARAAAGRSKGRPPSRRRALPPRSVRGSNAVPARALAGPPMGRHARRLRSGPRSHRLERATVLWAWRKRPAAGVCCALIV